jgi:hypothetical protein
MEALVKTRTEVLVKANSKKNKPLNDMSAVSARAFTVEETQKYAAAVMILCDGRSISGVLAGDDGGNSIIIRGNSPTGYCGKWKEWIFPIQIISARQEIPVEAFLFSARNYYPTQILLRLHLLRSMGML